MPAIVCRAEDAHRYTDRPLYVKALSFVAGNGAGLLDPDFDYTHFDECEAAAKDAYHQAGITDPRKDFDCAEVYVPFSWYEPMWLENLGFCAEGDGWKLTEAGATAPDGDIPWNPSGGVLEKAETEKILALAQKHGVPLYPFFLEGVAMQRDLNQADGIHPNAAGERIMTDTVWKTLEPLLKK